MSTTQPFYTTVPENGAITLPPEFRGKTVSLVVENRSEVQVPQKRDMKSFVEKYAGILNDCQIESVESMENERKNHLAEKDQ